MKSKKHRRYALIFAEAAFVVLIIGTLAWLYIHRTITGLGMINAPVRLELRSGHHDDVAQLYLGSINVKDENLRDSNGVYHKYYVFSVYGDAGSDYYLQLAYTTNIPFKYTFYAAKESGSGGLVAYKASNGKIYHYALSSTEPIAMNKLNSDGTIAHKSGPYHDATYRTDNGDYTYVQKNAEPIYQQSDNQYTLGNTRLGNSTKAGSDSCDYYIIDVSWSDSDNISNNRETDIIYLSAGASE